MKMDKEQAEEMHEVAEQEYPKYPYGLKLHLDTKALEKLGIKLLPGVGQKITLHAICEVCDVSQYQSSDGADNKSIGLQITDMALESGKTMSDVAKKMYGES